MLLTAGGELVLPLFLICFFAPTTRWTSQASCEVRGANASTLDILRNGSDVYLGPNLGNGNSALSFTYRLPLTTEKPRVECVEQFVITDRVRHDYIINFLLRANSWEESINLGQSRLIVIYADPDSGAKNVVKPMSSLIGINKKALLWSVVARPIGVGHMRQMVRMVLFSAHLSAANIKIIFTLKMSCSQGSIYQCDSYICINNSLVCNGDRNCPRMLSDDERECGKRNLIVLIICFSIFIIIIIIVFCVQLYTNRIRLLRSVGATSSHMVPQEPLEAEGAISSSFLPQSPPPYDRKAKMARPAGHDEPPSYSESKGPSVSVPIPQAAINRFAPRVTYSLDSSTQKVPSSRKSKESFL